MVELGFDNNAFLVHLCVKTESAVYAMNYLQIALPRATANVPLNAPPPNLMGQDSHNSSRHSNWLMYKLMV